MNHEKVSLAIDKSMGENFDYDDTELLSKLFCKD